MSTEISVYDSTAKKVKKEKYEVTFVDELNGRKDEELV